MKSLKNACPCVCVDDMTNAETNPEDEVREEKRGRVTDTEVLPAAQQFCLPSRMAAAGQGQARSQGCLEPRLLRVSGGTVRTLGQQSPGTIRDRVKSYFWFGSNLIKSYFIGK